MTISPNDRIVPHVLEGESASATNARRWAVVRLVFGLLQMFGAAISLGLFVYSGITRLTLTAVLATGVFTGTSMLLFQVWKRGGQSNEKSTRGDRTR
jgi:hypothetical protein